MPTFVKTILKPGTYTVNGKQVFISPEQVQRSANTFQQMKKDGLLIPAPYRHDPLAVPVRANADSQDLNAYQNAGYWRDMWINDAGELQASVEVPLEEDAKKIGTTVQEVSPVLNATWVDGNGKIYQDAITHVALVTHPIQTQQDNFKGLALSNTSFVGADRTNLAQDYNSVGTSDGNPSSQKIMATNATVAQALPILAKIGLSLPSDTNESNFAERVIVAAFAIQSHEACKEGTGENDNGDTKNPPKSFKEKPSPIAMANTENKPEFSPAQLAQIQFAQTTLLEKYRNRVETLVSNGTISAKYAIETLKPLIDSHSIEFSDDGKQVPSPLDVILNSLESLPANLSLTGKSPTSFRKENRTFKLTDTVSMSLQEQELPVDDMSEPEDIDAFLDAQFKVAGIL